MCALPPQARIASHIDATRSPASGAAHRHLRSAAGGDGCRAARIPGTPAGCRVYRPALHRPAQARMRFVAVRRPHAAAIDLGILEPDSGEELGPRCARSGVSATASASMRPACGSAWAVATTIVRSPSALRRCWHRPLLVGIAYALQRIDGILPAAHDVPLDRIVTEDGVADMQHWLLKTEPSTFGIDDLAARAAQDHRLGRRAQLPGAQLASATR